MRVGKSVAWQEVLAVEEVLSSDNVIVTLLHSVYVVAKTLVLGKVYLWVYLHLSLDLRHGYTVLLVQASHDVVHQSEGFRVEVASLSLKAWLLQQLEATLVIEGKPVWQLHIFQGILQVFEGVVVTSEVLRNFYHLASLSESLSFVWVCLNEVHLFHQFVLRVDLLQD